MAWITPLILLAGCDRQSRRPVQQDVLMELVTDGVGPGPGSGSGSGIGPVVDRSHAGAPMPDVLFQDAAGHGLRLASLIGRPVLVNFWATWCAPCVSELPALHRFALRHGNRMHVVAISEDSGGPAMVNTFWQAHGLAPWPFWRDPGNDARIATLPTTIYYDARGREVWRFIGGV